MKFFMISGMRSCLVILVLSLLTACGFHLRGPQTLVLPFKTMSLISAPGQLRETLRETLIAYRINITESAPLKLHIIDATWINTPLGLIDTGQTTPYLLTYTVTFEVLDTHHRILLPAQTITSQRNFTVSSNQFEGDLNTQEMLKTSLYQDITQQILMRLQSNELVAKMNS
jgi:LPS-assembly lipoprotein